MNYFNQSFIDCVGSVEWFVKDIDYIIDIKLDFKLPPILSKKSVVLIFKFIILQIKAHIKVYQKTEQIDGITEMLNDILTMYVLFYKKKNLSTCIRVLIYMLWLSFDINKLETAPQIDLTNIHVIKQCLGINLIYGRLNEIQPLQIEKESKQKQLSSKKQKKIEPKFLDDPRNQEFVRLIYDHTALSNHPPQGDMNLPRHHTPSGYPVPSDRHAPSGHHMHSTTSKMDKFISCRGEEGDEEEGGGDVNVDVNEDGVEDDGDEDRDGKQMEINFSDGKNTYSDGSCRGVTISLCE